MAKNMVFRYTDKLVRSVPALGTVRSGDPFVHGTTGSRQAAVALTDVGGSVTTSLDYPPYVISEIPSGGVGLPDGKVSAAHDGTWEFLTSTYFDVPLDVSTVPYDAPINYDTTTNKLTLSNISVDVVPFGHVDFPEDYDKTRGYLPVKIGAR